MNRNILVKHDGATYAGYDVDVGETCPDGCLERLKNNNYCSNWELFEEDYRHYFEIYLQERLVNEVKSEKGHIFVLDESDPDPMTVWYGLLKDWDDLENQDSDTLKHILEIEPCLDTPEGTDLISFDYLSDDNHGLPTIFGRVDRVSAFGFGQSIQDFAWCIGDDYELNASLKGLKPLEVEESELWEVLQAYAKAYYMQEED